MKWFVEVVIVVFLDLPSPNLKLNTVFLLLLLDRLLPEVDFFVFLRPLENYLSCFVHRVSFPKSR